ncbi:MAG: response regulator [Acidobacteriota bacterium]
MDVCAVRRGSLSVDSMWSAAAGRCGISVLLVTPDGELRATARRVLERAGYDVADAAHSGHALLACLTGRRVDIALVETAFEDMPGLALVEKLRRRQPGLRAVYVGQPDAAPQPDRLARPLSSDALLEHIEALISVPAS